MKAKITRIDLWSIIFLTLAFLVFSVAIPIIQESIDSTNDSYTKYIFNLQQSALKHGRFIDTHDKGHFFEILLQENIVTERQKKAVLRILKRVEFRAQNQLAGAILLGSIDPTDESDSPALRLTKLQQRSIEDLEKEFEKLNSPEPTKIGQKLMKELKYRKNCKSIGYVLGSLFFIVGTIFQIISKKTIMDQNKNVELSD